MDGNTELSSSPEPGGHIGYTWRGLSLVDTSSSARNIDHTIGRSAYFMSEVLLGCYWMRVAESNQLVLCDTRERLARLVEMLTLDFVSRLFFAQCALDQLGWLFTMYQREQSLTDLDIDLERIGDALQTVYSTMTGLAECGRRLISYFGKIWPGG